MSKKENYKNASSAEGQEQVSDPGLDQMEKNEQEEKGAAADETEALKQEIEKEKDRYMRLFAEFENYKRRTGKERIEFFKTANEEVLASLLPVLDDFDRATTEISNYGDTELLKGVELIYNKLKETLKSKGLTLMEVKSGDAFDSELHDAVTQIPAANDSLKGKIVDVVQKGYVLSDKIIRYPKVVTGK